MGLAAEIPTFGHAPAGVRIVRRPSAYAVVGADDGLLAVVRTTKGWFLLGGGIEPGESPAEAVVREGREKRCTFLAATIGATGLECDEEDHILVWLAPAAAVGALVHESHRWAIERWLERAVDGG